MSGECRGQCNARSGLFDSEHIQKCHEQLGNAAERESLLAKCEQLGRMPIQMETAIRMVQTFTLLDALLDTDTNEVRNERAVLKIKRQLMQVACRGTALTRTDTF